MIWGAAILAAALTALAPAAAEAARCPKGQIYRVSHGICQSKATAIRQGVYRPRAQKPRVRVARLHRAHTNHVPRPPRREAVEIPGFQSNDALRLQLWRWIEINRSWLEGT
jgi:hypothetical protein